MFPSRHGSYVSKRQIDSLVTMSRLRKTITFAPERVDSLQAVAVLLKKYPNDTYYAYERGDFWYVGLGANATLTIDPTGKTATFVTKGNQEVRNIEGSLADVARDFVQQNSKHGGKVHGYVSFNYAAEIRKQSYSAGEWPLLTLVIPRNEIYIHPDYINVIAQDEFIMAELCDVLVTGISSFDCPRPNLKVDTAENGEDYKERVTQVLSDISAGQYTKAIASRAVDIHYEIDMPATLFQGRLGNTPARSFCINHDGFQATGFSPELVCLLENNKVTTEPLAGTRARVGTVEEIAKLREELISDPKEVLEHIMSVKAAIVELEGFCVPDSVIVEDLMSVRERGPAQHLGSRVSGAISPTKDGWDAFDVLFPAITASGIPKSPALAAIERLEPRPRELYSGAVLLLEGKNFFESALVLRTVFQHGSKRWIQAGAGIIAQSKPEREFTETREKLASIAPFLVVKGVDSRAVRVLTESEMESRRIFLANYDFSDSD